jgi:hypothetical protein
MIIISIILAILIVIFGKLTLITLDKDMTKSNFFLILYSICAITLVALISIEKLT